MTRAADNAAIELWRLQARLGIAPADRRMPVNDNVDAFERDLEVIRQAMERA